MVELITKHFTPLEFNQIKSQGEIFINANIPYNVRSIPVCIS